MTQDRHLPKFLRDFHDQKKVFQACNERIYGSSYSAVNWIAGHVYVIDCFLKFMALHGYALKKVRSDGEDIAQSIQQLEDAKLAVFKQIAANQGKQ